MGTKKECFFAYVPVLGIATDADTLEQVQKEIKSLIEFHLQCLAEEDFSRHFSSYPETG